LIFVVTEKLAQDVDKKWFFEKGVVTGRALPPAQAGRAGRQIPLEPQYTQEAFNIKT
jgi:hypothetical protein